MERSKKVLIFNTLSVILVILGIVTLLPFKIGNKPNLIGFFSVCSFAPISTLICLYSAYVVNTLKKRALKTEE